MSVDYGRVDALNSPISTVKYEIGESKVRVISDDVLHSYEDIYDSDSDDEQSKVSYNKEELVINQIDTDVPRAQIDTGAKVSVTNMKEALFDYVPYNEDRRCPIVLKGAVQDAPEVTPEGYGYLRIPMNDEGGYANVHTYYSPEIASTLVSENSLLRACTSKRMSEDYSGQDLIKRFGTDGTGTLEIINRHKRNSALDIIIPGVIIGGQCYTKPLTMVNAWREHTVKVEESLNVILGVDNEEPREREIEIPIQAIKTRTEKLLWHQRLGHPCDEYLYNAHKVITGVPKFTRETSVLDQCPTCIQAKQSKEPSGSKTTKMATKPFAGLSIDFSFSGLQSDDEQRRLDFEGFNGESCYILVTDHSTGMKFGTTRMSKAPPTKWLQKFLKKNAPLEGDKYVVLDQGGELYNSPDVTNVLKDFGYDIRPTGADNSRQNGPVERAHRSVSNMIRALLLGANLDVRFWPYAFDHCIRLWNSMPSKQSVTSPYEQLHHRKPDFTKLRTFGCRVWVRPPQGRRAKFIPNSRKGVFLGYTPGNTTNILWYDPETNRVKIASHARFDEGMNDLPLDLIPPNVRHLQRFDDGQRLPLSASDDLTSPHREVHFYGSPFSTTTKASLDTTTKPHGLVFQEDELSKRPYISDINPRGAAAKLHSTLRATRNKLRGAYLVSINGHPVYSSTDVNRIMKHLQNEGVKKFDIIYAPTPKLDGKRYQKAKNEFNERHPKTGQHIEDNNVSEDDMATHERTPVTLPTLRENVYIGKRVAKIFSGRVYYGTVTEHWKEKGKQLRWHVRYDDGDEEDYNVKELKFALKLQKEHQEDDPKRVMNIEVCKNDMKPLEDMVNILPSIDTNMLRAIARIRYQERDNVREKSIEKIPHDLVDMVINAIGSQATTEEEQALGYFTRKKLKRLSTWAEWLAGEKKQLNQFEALGMYGEPVLLEDESQNIILRPHWQYNIKRDGTRRSRLCCNGSKRAAPLLHALAMTYSSCVEHPIQRLFLGIAAHLNLKLYGGDAKDAYGHSPGPEIPTFMRIDDAYFEWYKDKYGIELDRRMVLPVRKALQGHPESGRLWEKHISGILQKLGFESTTHDRTIYRKKTVDIESEGDYIYMLRQVDDFAIACKAESTAIGIYNRIGEELQTEKEENPPFAYLGLITDFNGIDISQRKEYIEVSCTNYIERVLRSHKWETECNSKTTYDSPMTKEALDQVYKHEGPKEGTKEHADLEAKSGFGYRNLLGELMFCYISCRCDIGYAITLLSKFSTMPSEFHYACLKRVAKYLRRTKKWGIRYKRNGQSEDLPNGDFDDMPKKDGDLPEYPKGVDSGRLTCFVDAAYANDQKKRRSTTGYALTFAGGAIVYQSKTQSITALSSTEAELIAAVTAAKAVRFVRSVLNELGFTQREPTHIYEDNKPTIDIVNSGKPTQRSRHIDVRFFALQDWREAGDVILIHISGVINPADDLTKPLGWVLHNRHARYMMGHYHYQSDTKVMQIVMFRKMDRRRK